MGLSSKQLELLKIKNLKEKTIVIDGGVRSGKTLIGSTFGFCELIINQQTHHPIFEGNRYAIIGCSSSKMTYNNVTARVIQYLSERGFNYKRVRPQADDFVFTKGKIKFYIETYACNTEISWHQFQGATFRSVFIDEASLIHRSNIENATTRTMSFSDAKVIMVSNPVGSKAHWYYETYINNHHLKGIAYYKFTLMDNPIIPKDVIEHYKKLYTNNIYQQRVLGNWVVDEGAVYKKLPPPLTLTTTPDHLYFGLDFGEADATSVTAVGYFSDENLGYYVILDQYYHSNRKDEQVSKTITDYLDDIVNFINKVTERYDVNAGLYVETSPISMYNLLRQDHRIHPKINVHKVSKKKTDYRSKDTIQERIDVTNLLINNNRLFILDTKLPIYQAFNDAEYDKNGRRLDNNTSDIDSLDSFEYAIKVDFKIIMQEMGYVIQEVDYIDQEEGYE